MTAVCQHGIRQPWECKDCLYETHTPGPWSLSDDPIRKVIRSEGPRPRTICIIEDWTREADARLMAAAPDLLHALERIVNAKDGCPPDEDWKRAEAAMKKAGWMSP